MIYTITFNPALDYVVGISNFCEGSLNRTEYEEVYAGGKGINVSLVLHNLGIPSVALGFIAGFTGEEIQRRVQKAGCQTDFISLEEGMSRINVKMKSKIETEINGQGPKISSEKMEELFQKLNNLQENDILVLAGSIPSTLPEDMYERIMAKLQTKNVKIIVDATKNLLMNVLKYHPFLIKPNHHELGELFGLELKTDEDIVTYAKKLQTLGARNVLVSMAKNGAILVTEEGTIYKSPAPKGKLVNSVGAGDSMVAGFIAGYLKHHAYKDAFYTGVATGSASAFSKGLATKDKVEELLHELTGEEK